MKVISQRFWHTEVARERFAVVRARTAYMDHDREMLARIEVDAKSFAVQKAVLETYRSPGRVENQVLPVTQLEGVQAYLGSGRALKQGLKNIEPLAAALFAEAVRGLIQAETFLLAERGFTSREEYAKYWDAHYSGSCRYYSNLSRVTRTWDQYVGDVERKNGALFTRFKTQCLYSLHPGSFYVAGNLSDTFHELHATIQVDENSRVLDARAELLRVPDRVCREAADEMVNLPGLELAGANKKEIAALLGREQGCVHLIDVVYDAGETLRLGLF